MIKLILILEVASALSGFFITGYALYRMFIVLKRVYKKDVPIFFNRVKWHALEFK